MRGRPPISVRQASARCVDDLSEATDEVQSGLDCLAHRIDAEAAGGVEQSSAVEDHKCIIVLWPDRTHSQHELVCRA
jgi:hypothetical protein